MFEDVKGVIVVFLRFDILVRQKDVLPLRFRDVQA